MLLVVLIAAHRANGLPFDVATRVKCWNDAWREAKAAREAGIPEQMIQTPEGIPVPPPPPIERCYATLPETPRQ